MMENLKIRVFTGQQTKTVIELAEKLGYKEKYPKGFKLTDGYVCLKGGKDILKVCIIQAGSELNDFREISIFDLCGVTKPQHKEYLDPHNNYELIEWEDGFMVQDHWIEVPDGAESLLSFNNGLALVFYKQDLNYVVGDNEGWNKLSVYYEHLKSRCPHVVTLWHRDTKKEYLEPMPNGDFRYHLDNGISIGDDWIEVPSTANYLYKNNEHGNVVFTALEMGYRDSSIVWQRHAQPEELPFIDDEPTAWDTQVGGNHYKQFKIQPMQFALENKLDAAQHNVIKYVMRHADKNGKEDLEKAKHYIDLMIEHYYGDL